jgi:hypothetical protein
VFSDVSLLHITSNGIRRASLVHRKLEIEHHKEERIEGPDIFYQLGLGEEDIYMDQQTNEGAGAQ